MKTLGNYEYNEEVEIGRGAFGIVYKGRNKTNLTQIVAIKLIATQQSLKILPEAINREIDILKTLSDARHKNIVTLLHCEKHEDYTYFVMEFCNGGNLQEYLRSKEKLDESVIRIFLRQIAGGLKVAHDMHIIHRDLKPENILFYFSESNYPSPDRITLKIADFGIGRFLDENEMARTLCGTPQYMAPEVLLGRPYDYKVDLWGVGVISYECFNGSLPKDSLLALSNDDIIQTNISPDFVHLLNGLLDTDEHKRFSIKEFVSHRFLNSTVNTSAGLLPGDGTKTVGYYEYNEKNVLGQGMYGKVYKGRNKKNLHMVVAVKDVDLRSWILKQSPESISREIEILEALLTKQQRNIVTPLHCERQTYNAYLVMEFCNGGSLKEYLQKKNALNERTIRTFLGQIAAGLKFVHDMHIVHRDLKPDNVLLSFSDQSPEHITLKIADFGVGRFLHSNEMALTFCGSRLYMAPEILVQRTGGYDYKADIWSVGVIAYECFAGSLPKDSIIALHGIQKPENATKDFYNLLKGLLQDDANKRFTLQQVFDHPFFAIPITVAVCGPSGETTMIPVKNDQSVDHLIDTIRDAYRINSKDFYLMHNGEILEGGRGKSLRESGIRHYSSIILNAEVRAGRKMKGCTDTSGCFGQKKCLDFQEKGCLAISNHANNL